LGIASLGVVKFGGVIYAAREGNDEVVGWFERIVLGGEGAFSRKPSAGEGDSSDFGLRVGVLRGVKISPQCRPTHVRFLFWVNIPAMGTGE
jgi:hypothetical protein